MTHLLIATPSASLRGGVERILESLARGLPAHGFRVTLGLAAGMRWHRPSLFRQEYPGLDTIDIGSGSGTRAGRLRGLRRALDKARPDIVLNARLFDVYEAVCRRKAEGDPVRLAVTIQTYEPEYIVDLRTYAEWVDCCVTSGRLVQAAVTRFTPLSPERVVSIPGGVRRAARPVDRRPGTPLRLGYVGRLEQGQKRVLDLVGVLIRLREWGLSYTCRIVGSGPSEEALRASIREHDLVGAVTFEGWRQATALYEDVYPKLDVLLHFAAWEGITIAPREAMAHGVVPVVSRFLGLNSEGHFRDGENCLAFDVGDLETAARSVVRLSQDGALWERLSTSARLSEEGEWSDEGAIEAWARAFTAATASPCAVGRGIPSLALPPSGRLARLVGEQMAERIRGLVGRHASPVGPGDEWPHAGCGANPPAGREILEFARQAESAASPSAAPGAPGRISQ